MFVESMVIITRVYDSPYREEKKILSCTGDCNKNGRIIYKGQSNDLRDNFDIPKELQGDKNEETFILCINGQNFRFTENNLELKGRIKNIFNKLKIRCGICHPGGRHTLSDVLENNDFLEEVYLNTYSKPEESIKILNLLNEILNSNENNRNEKLRDLYDYINKEKYISAKKKILANWLPLAIDIQGLSEVYQKSIKGENKADWEKKAKEYWEEIKDSVNNFEQLLKEHNVIAGDYKELKVEGLGQNGLKSFLTYLDSKEKNELPDNYLDPQKYSFFINWLEDIANK